MSMDVGKKIREIREALELGRAEFSLKTGIPIGTLTGIEQGRHEPKAGVLISIAQNWPQYAAYLLTDSTNVEQVNPETDRDELNLKAVGEN